MQGHNGLFIIPQEDTLHEVYNESKNINFHLGIKKLHEGEIKIGFLNSPLLLLYDHFVTHQCKDGGEETIIF